MLTAATRALTLDARAATVYKSTMSLPSVTDVFVAGGLPTVTYIPREGFGLEKVITRYLQTRHKILSISGQTKSGKTVLVRKIIPKNQGVWISGGQVTEVDEMWEAILDQLGGHTTLGSTSVQTDSNEEAAEGSVSVKPSGMGYEGKRSSKSGEQLSRTLTGSRTVGPNVAAINRLMTTKMPLVIDDFHYIEKSRQEQIIRSLKDPVFEGLPVILISVPHRAFDSVRVEKEMTGRVQQQPIPEWQISELDQIPRHGFDALNVDCDQAIISRLVEEAFGSPHLMQDFCLGLAQDVEFSEVRRGSIMPPADWEAFFRSRAADTSKSAFDRLAQGPRQRTTRVERKLKDGTTCDIYNAVLLAIASTGPKTRLSYEDVRDGLNRVLVELPQANEVTRVLEKMSEISKEEIQGEPVVDWDKEFSTLHVSDPFFAYYLRWGVKLPI